MKKKPYHLDVSVILPAYNSERFIETTIRSILNQRGINLELIVVDDCSTDRTSFIVKKLATTDSRVYYYKTDTNFGGPAGPRNIGLKYAIADWVAFCDADDLWSPLKLKAQLHCAEVTGSNFICSEILVFSDHKPNFRDINSMKYEKINFFQMVLKNRIATSSVLCRKQDLLDLGGFNESRKLIAAEDYDLWLRVMTNVKMIKLRSYLVLYRHSIDSLSSVKLKMVLKVIYVHMLLFKRNRLFFLYPLAFPVLLISYFVLSLYQRYLNKTRSLYRTN